MWDEKSDDMAFFFQTEVPSLHMFKNVSSDGTNRP